MVAWLLVGATGRFAVSQSLQGRAGATATVLGLEATAVWALAWVAALVPRTATLTALRIVVPAATVTAVVTFFTGASVVWATAFTVASLGAVATLAHPVTVDAFVDGSAYGPERRFALRTPLLLALVAVPPVWLLATMVAIVPGLAVTGLWIPALAIGVIWALVLPRAVGSMHLPAQRFLVFVPAGIVLSDPLVLTDRLLFPRRNVTTLGPAFADTDATDLTRGASGLALQLDLDEPFEIPFRTDTSDGEEVVGSDRLVFSVLRPGALLATAQERRVVVGETLARAPHCVHDTEPASTGESQTAVPLPRTRSSR